MKAKWKSRLTWFYMGMVAQSIAMRTAAVLGERAGQKDAERDVLLIGGQDFEPSGADLGRRFSAHIADASPEQRKAAHAILSDWQSNGRRRPPSEVLNAVLAALSDA